MHRSQAGDRRIDERHPREERRERAERRAGAAVFLADQKAPVAGAAQIGEHRVGDLAVVVEQRAGLLVPLHDGDRIVHHALHVGRRFRRRAHEQFDRHAAVPHGPMRRAVHRLILGREQRFDLVVGRIDRAGAPGFVGALAAEREGRFGKRSVRGSGLSAALHSWSVTFVSRFEIGIS